MVEYFALRVSGAGTENTLPRIHPAFSLCEAPVLPTKKCLDGTVSLCLSPPGCDMGLLGTAPRVPLATWPPEENEKDRKHAGPHVEDENGIKTTARELGEGCSQNNF